MQQQNLKIYETKTDTLMGRQINLIRKLSRDSLPEAGGPPGRGMSEIILFMSTEVRSAHCGRHHSLVRDWVCSLCLLPASRSHVTSCFQFLLLWPPHYGALYPGTVSQINFFYLKFSLSCILLKQQKKRLRQIFPISLLEPGSLYTLVSGVGVYLPRHPRSILRGWKIPHKYCCLTDPGYVPSTYTHL